MYIKQDFLTPNKYSRPQTPLKSVTKIALHNTGNPRSKASSNKNYFESLKNVMEDRNGNLIYASAHYIVGLDGEIIQCIPECEIAYATYSANSYSISIEFCHPDDTGKPNDKTLSSLIELCLDLCDRYDLNPLTDIIRHYDVPKDVNGYRKPCPLYYVENENEFIKLKQQIYDKLHGISEYDIALERLVKNGIINEPKKWQENTIDVANVKYLMRSFIQKAMTQEDMANILFLLGVITTPTAWYHDKDMDKNYIKQLIINMGNKFK